jgi:hypothetical protein
MVFSLDSLPRPRKAIATHWAPSLGGPRQTVFLALVGFVRRAAVPARHVRERQSTSSRFPSNDEKKTPRLRGDRIRLRLPLALVILKMGGDVIIESPNVRPAREGFHA